MAFITVPGLVGKLYAPDSRPQRSKKHSCADCFGCQQCSDGRCSLCRSGTMAAPPAGDTTVEKPCATENATSILPPLSP